MYLRLSKRSLALLLSISAAAIAPPVLAQESTELPPVLVEGATIEVLPAPKQAAAAAAKPKPKSQPAVQQQPLDIDVPSPATSGIPLDEIGTSVSVVTGGDFRRQQIDHAADALRSLPGVAVNRSGGPQSLTAIRIRGAEANHTLVLIDGVEVNSSDGVFDFSNLMTEDIDRVEVLRGPQSGLYGSGALGGVVNVITKQGRGPLTVRVRGEGGSSDTNGGAVSLSGGNDKIFGNFSLFGQRTNGFNISEEGDEDDGAKFANASFSGGAEVLPGLLVQGTIRRSRVEGDRDDFDGYNAQGFNVVQDSLSHFDNTLMVRHISATLNTFDGYWTHMIEAGSAETDSTDIGLGMFSGETHTISGNQKYAYTSTVRIDTPSMPAVTHYVTGRIEEQRDTFDQPLGTDPKRERERTSYVGEVRGEYFNSLFLTGTIREDKNELYDDFTTWHGAASFKVPETAFRLHSGFGTGVRYPSFAQLFGQFFGFIPNPGLVPEEAFGWDGGVETSLFKGLAVVDVTYFETDLKNEIDDLFFPNFTSSVFNRTGKSKRDGIEVAARFQVTKEISIGGAYTYLRASEDDGREEIRRPPHSGRIDFNYAFDKGRGNINLAAIYNGETQDVAFNLFDPALDRVSLDEYWFVNAAASYEVSPGVQLYGRVENLLDERYQEVFSMETAGISAFAGVKLTYEELASKAWSEGKK
jgi:vitamin B12 transporter